MRASGMTLAVLNRDRQKHMCQHWKSICPGDQPDRIFGKLSLRKNKNFGFSRGDMVQLAAHVRPISLRREDEHPLPQTGQIQAIDLIYPNH